MQIMARRIENWGFTGRPTIRDRRGVSVRDITEHETEQFDPTRWMRGFSQVVDVSGGLIRDWGEVGSSFRKALYSVDEALEQHELPLPDGLTPHEQLSMTYQIGRNLGFYDRFRPREHLKTQPLTGDELAIEVALKIGKTNREAAENMLRGWTHAAHLGRNQRAESMGGYKGHSAFVDAKSNFLIDQLNERL